MKINIYKRYQDKHYIDGEVYHKKEINGVTFKEDAALDVVHPKVVLNLLDQNWFEEVNDLNGYNYMYIPQLRSWYWLTWYTECGLVVFEGERDPLKTFWDDIKKTEQYITRAQRNKNLYIVDNNLPIHSDHNYKIKTFGQEVYKKDCNCVILETVGKGGTPT